MGSPSRYTRVFQDIGYKAPGSLLLYRGLLLSLDEIISILSRGSPITPRKISSWTHDPDVAEEILYNHLIRKCLPNDTLWR